MIPRWFSRVIREGDHGSDVDIVVRRLGLPGRSHFDSVAVAIVKGLGLKFGIETEGEVNSRIAEAIGESEANRAGLLPDWYPTQDPVALTRILKRYEFRTVTESEFDIVSALKRWQGNHGFRADGVLTPELAQLLGD